MPFFDDFTEFDLEMINILIEKEKKEQNSADYRPFLQLPTPYIMEKPQKNDENEEKNDVIIIDL